MEMVLLVCLLLVGFYVRTVGIDFGLPLLFHPDEPFIVERTRRMVETGDMNPHAFNYPTLFMYLLYLIFKVQYVVLEEVTRSTLYLTARTFVALMGSLSIVTCYFIGKELYDRETGLIAALIISLVPMAVRDSHFATVDIPLVLLVTLAFYSIALIPREGTLRRYLISGALAGLATSIKYNGGLLILPLFVAFLLDTCRSHAGHDVQLTGADGRLPSITLLLDHCMKKGDQRRLVFPGIERLALAFLAMALAFMCTTPYAVLDSDTFMKDLGMMSAFVRGGHGVTFTGTASGYIYHLQHSLNTGLTTGVEIVCIAGFLVILTDILSRRTGTETGSGLLLMSWIVPYYMIIGTWEVKFDRYVMPLLPFLSVCAGVLIHRLSVLLAGIASERWHVSRIKPLGAFIICFSVSLLIVDPLRATKTINNDFLKLDTRQVSLHWIGRNIPEDSSFFREPYTPDIELLDRYNVTRFNYEIERMSLSEIAAADYLIISSDVYSRYYSHPEDAQEQIDFYDSIHSDFHLVREFHPNETTKGPIIKLFATEEHDREVLDT